MIERHVQCQTTSICNGRCTICPYRGSEVEKTATIMTDDVFNAIVAALKDRVKIKKLACYMQGEPFTDLKIFERMKTVKEQLWFDHLELSTNCKLLSRPLLEELIEAADGIELEMWLSFHGATKEEYEATMGFEYGKMLGRLTMALKMLDEAGIRWRVVSSPQSVRPFFESLFADLGVKNGNCYLPKLTNRGGNKPEIAEVCRDDWHCSRHTDWLHFDVDGNVVMCCDDYQRKVKFGNVLQDGLPKVLESVQYQLEELAKNKNFMCYKCTTPGGMA